ncbi:MAG: ABC transporter permease [Bauldia sp.]|nr:ABC transporter permease [Bauldia sp.]
MKTATESSADLAAMRRPAAGNALVARLRNYQATNIVVVFLVLMAAAIGWSILYPEQLRFATAGNLAILSQQIPVTAIVAIGVGLLMISGEFDISIAGTFTLVPFIVAIASGGLGWPLALAFAAGLVVAIAIGLANGLVTTRLGIPSFIATLGMMFVLRGVVRFVSINPKTNQPDSIAFFLGEPVETLLTGEIVGPLYAQMVWLAVVALAGYLLLNRHRFGNHLLAAGGNRNAALAVGVPVSRVKITAFVICAVAAGFAGILQAARINQIEPSFATISGLELKAIAAVVVGGVSLRGGRGAILGMVLGAALLDIVDNLLVLISAPETVFKGFLGAIIIVAVVLNTLVGKREARA